MSIREQLWDCIGDRTVTRAELYALYGPDVRKAISRMEKMGEIVRVGENFRRGEKAQTAFRPWDESELAVLRAYIHEGYDAVHERLPGRSRVAIKQRADTLRVGPKRSAKPRLHPSWPAFTRGHLSPVVRACLPEVA